MTAKESACDWKERRSSPRRVLDRFYSVEFKIKDLLLVYHCKLRDVSSKGLCILIREDSPLFRTLKPGTLLEMRFYPLTGHEPPVPLTTRIAHITPQEQGRYRRHCLVGLEVLWPAAESAEPDLDGEPSWGSQEVLKLTSNRSQ